MKILKSVLWSLGILAYFLGSSIPSLVLFFVLVNILSRFLPIPSIASWTLLKWAVLSLWAVLLAVAALLSIRQHKTAGWILLGLAGLAEILAIVIVAVFPPIPIIYLH